MRRIAHHQENAWARIPVHTVAGAPEPSRDALKSLEAKFGKVLNIHGGMAHSPVVLQAYAAVQQVITEQGTFDPATREAIARWWSRTSTAASTARRRTPWEASEPG